jgi:uncharacterized membrane protein
MKVISAHHAPLHWFNTHHKSIHYRQNHSSISSKNSRGKICFSFVISLFFFMVLVFSIANEPSQIVSIQTQLELKISKLASSSYTQFELVLQMSSMECGLTRPTSIQFSTLKEKRKEK